MPSDQQKPSPQIAGAGAAESSGSSSNEQSKTVDNELEYEDDYEILRRQAEWQIKNLEKFEGANSKFSNAGSKTKSKNNAEEDKPVAAADQKAMNSSAEEAHADADDSANAYSDQLSDSTGTENVNPTRPELATAASENTNTSAENGSIFREDEQSTVASDRIETASTAEEYDESATANQEIVVTLREDEAPSDEVDIAGDEPMIEEAEDEYIDVGYSIEESEEVLENELRAETVYGEVNLAVRDTISATIVASNDSSDDDDEALEDEDSLEEDDDDDSSSELHLMIHSSPAATAATANAATQPLFPPWNLMTQNRMRVQTAVPATQPSDQRDHWHNQLFQQGARLARRRFQFRRHSTENATAAAALQPEAGSSAALTRDKPVVFSRVDERNSIFVGSGISAMAVSQLGVQQRQNMKSQAGIVPNLITGEPCSRRLTHVRVSPEIFNNRLLLECQLAANSFKTPRQTYSRRQSAIKSTWNAIKSRK